MATYYVDDGGDNSDGTTWAKAYQSWEDLETGRGNLSFASGDIIYVGSDHVDTASLTSNQLVSGDKYKVISATVGSSPPTYAKGTSAQLTSNTGYDMDVTGTSHWYGVWIKSNGVLSDLKPGSADYMYWYDCTFETTFTNGSFNFSGGSDAGCRVVTKNCTIITTDTATAATYLVTLGGSHEVTGMTVDGDGYRTDACFRILGPGPQDINGWNGVTAGDHDEPIAFQSNYFPKTSAQNMRLSTGSTFTQTSVANPYDHSPGAIWNVSNTSDDAYYYMGNSTYGSTLGTNLIYRTGGAEVEGGSVAWLVTTTATTNEYTRFDSPWIHGYSDTTGNKTFSIYITNDTADFDDDEVWMEFEYYSTAGVNDVVFEHDGRVTGTAAAQTDDTTSTWNGTGPSFTYKQKLSVNVTLGKAGRYRARVICAKASVTSSSYFYVDPIVVVG